MRKRYGDAFLGLCDLTYEKRTPLFEELPVEVVACCLCGASDYSEVLSQQDLAHHLSSEFFSVVKCRQCQLLYLNPRPTRDEMSAYYPPEYFPENGERHVQSLERIARRQSGVKRYIREDFYGYPFDARNRILGSLRRMLLWPEKIRRELRGQYPIPWCGSGRVLDVGCGAGTNMIALQAQGWDVHGVDVSPVAVSLASSYFGDRVQLGTLHSARYADRSFDVVLFSHSLEHMFNPIEVLREAHRVLVHEGRVVVTLPNAGGAEAKIFGKWWFPWELPRHLFHFDEATLRRMLSVSGFHVLSTRTGVGTLYFLASLERVLRYRFGRTFRFRTAIEKFVAKPFCLVAGHLGHGTELTAYAEKR
ncbi:MAG: putative methyltransferase [Nitrospira sp.]|nr:MAG: putative methyltransferase [Nitrospira sp.]